MPLPKKTTLDNIGPKHKSDDMKAVRESLADAKQKLIAAQKANDEKLIKFYQQSIAHLTGTIERNS
ncbi:MAG: hypothetical protein NC311_00455 [Muribaculaceae bacterium]|nr:hypothetical protein [Muribaculaceae bacterium]MCM1441891.1 hypothetical protein [Roseburia sp.]